MNYPEYKADLQRIHESEVYGRAVFATAARLTRDLGLDSRAVFATGFSNGPHPKTIS